MSSHTTDGDDGGTLERTAAGARLRFVRHLAHPPAEVWRAITEPEHLDTFTELGKAARDGAGWHTCLDQLQHHLDGTTASWTHSERWRQVHPSYVQRLGPEAATIGPPAGALDD